MGDQGDKALVQDQLEGIVNMAGVRLGRRFAEHQLGVAQRQQVVCVSGKRLIQHVLHTRPELEGNILIVEIGLQHQGRLADLVRGEVVKPLDAVRRAADRLVAKVVQALRHGDRLINRDSAVIKSREYVSVEVNHIDRNVR